VKAAVVLVLRLQPTGIDQHPVGSGVDADADPRERVRDRPLTVPSSRAVPLGIKYRLRVVFLREVDEDLVGVAAANDEIAAQFPIALLQRRDVSEEERALSRTHGAEQVRVVDENRDDRSLACRRRESSVIPESRVRSMPEQGHTIGWGSER